MLRVFIRSCFHAEISDKYVPDTLVIVAFVIQDKQKQETWNLLYLDTFLLSKNKTGSILFTNNMSVSQYSGKNRDRFWP